MGYNKDQPPLKWTKIFEAVRFNKGTQEGAKSIPKTLQLLGVSDGSYGVSARDGDTKITFKLTQGEAFSFALAILKDYINSGGNNA